jgi:hypothetical protein
MGGNPLFSASANGTASSAAEKAFIAYCSIEDIYHKVIMLEFSELRKVDPCKGFAEGTRMG